MNNDGVNKTSKSSSTDSFSMWLVVIIIVAVNVIAWLLFNQARDGDIRDLENRIENLEELNKNHSSRIDLLSTKKDTISVTIHNYPQSSSNIKKK